MEEAIKKLQDEMEQNKDAYTQTVGGFMQQYVKNHPQAVDLILAEGKTIKGSLDTMRKKAGDIGDLRKEAEKNKTGNYGTAIAVLSDEQGYAAVLEYYGIKGQPQGQARDINAGGGFSTDINSYLE